MSEPRREKQVLADFTFAGAQAAGTWQRPSAAAVSGELDSHEVAEITEIEIIPPLTVLGLPEDIMVQLNLDDKLEQYNYFYGHRDRLVWAPEHNTWGSKMALGKPLFNINGGFAGAIQALCPKFRKRATFEVLTVGGVTVGYRVIIKGYRYKAAELPFVVPSQVGGSDVITDTATGRRTEIINKGILVPSEDTWTQLPGGLDQQVPKIHAFNRIAVNALATTPNLPYQYRFDTGAVALREQDLEFEYATDKKVVVIKGLGVRVAAANNLAEVFVDVGGNERPKNRWALTEWNNDKWFGHMPPLVGLLNIFKPIPMLDDRLLFYNENCYFNIVDNGAACAANSVWIAVNGIMVELT